MVVKFPFFSKNTCLIGTTLKTFHLHVRSALADRCSVPISCDTYRLDLVASKNPWTNSEYGKYDV